MIFPPTAKKEAGVNVTIADLAERCRDAIVIGEDDDAAQLLAQHGPAVYVFMSSKDIYKLKKSAEKFSIKIVSAFRGMLE